MSDQNTGKMPVLRWRWAASVIAVAEKAEDRAQHEEHQDQDQETAKDWDEHCQTGSQD